MDIVSRQKRAEMMSGIGPKDTNPELQVRKLLHHAGFRFRLHRKDLPGKPDIVLPKYGALIQVHGCFWHRHLRHLFKWPTSREEFWRSKLEGNAQRDLRNRQKCKELGWKTLVVWECALKGTNRLPEPELAFMLEAWLINDPHDAEIGGRTPQIQGTQ